MIFAGYPCIGKSKICKENPDLFIDLDCNARDKTDPLWQEHYGDEAIELSKQGKIVFVSLHKILRDYIFSKVPDDFAIIVPKAELKNEWIEHLKHRYNHTPTSKNLNALQLVEKFYDLDIKAEQQLEAKGVKTIWINTFISKDFILDWIKNNK
jgi:hypothetical protein